MPHKSFAFIKLAQPKVRELSKVTLWSANRPLLADWVLCAATISVSMRAESWPVYLIVVVLVGAIQHGLLIIVHEGAHFRLSSKRTANDLISDLFAAFPIFFCTHGYRENHWDHHQFLNSERDPDWARKVRLTEWQFPKTRAGLALLMVKVLFTSWYKMIALFWNLSGLGKKAVWVNSARRRLLLMKLVYYACLFTVLTATSSWKNFSLYWVIPYLFVMPIVERIRSIAEHFALESDHELHMTRNVLCWPIEGFFFGPHNIRYHLAHHLFPTVPQYNLPKLHEYLMGFSEYAEHSHQNRSYLFGKKSVIGDILNLGPTNG
jgi:fatty acid desaturase